LILAGGALALVGCSTNKTNNSSTTNNSDASLLASGGSSPTNNPDAHAVIPCGNANPDPCICGRPAADPQQAALCTQEQDCQALGGQFDPTTFTAADGTITAPHCILADASVSVIPGIPCGNANSDPCICGRPEAGPDEAALCTQEQACRAAGGQFDPTTFTAADGTVTGPHCILADGGALNDGSLNDGSLNDGSTHD
jgi:hypothetical protein